MKRSKLTHKLAALATIGAGLGSSPAFATTTTVANIVDNVGTSASAIPRLFALFAYIGGAALCMAGILKLKAHVDNPGQTKITEGLSRLFAGGLLFCLPIATAALQGSIANGDSTAADTTKMLIMNTGAFVAQ